MQLVLGELATEQVHHCPGRIRSAGRPLYILPVPLMGSTKLCGVLGCDVDLRLMRAIVDSQAGIPLLEVSAQRPVERTGSVQQEMRPFLRPPHLLAL